MLPSRRGWPQAADEDALFTAHLASDAVAYFVGKVFHVGNGRVA
jgi:hypothetical protein